MIIHIKELKQGQNEVSFEIPAETFESYLKDLDELYAAASEPCSVEITVNRFEDSLFLKGHVEAPIRFDCARCLASREDRVDMEFRWTMFPQRSLSVERLSEEEEIELSEDDLEVSFYEGEEVDLKELIRELILLEMESAPTCEPGQCSDHSGMDALMTEEELANRVDPRWEKLKELKKQLANSNGDS